MIRQYLLYNNLSIYKLKMKKKDLCNIRHPYYPEIIKFKKGSVKTTSTLSTSNHDEDFNNLERFSCNDNMY